MEKRYISIVFILIIVFLLSTCDYELYDGSYPELYVVATHSLLGVWGGGIWEDIFVLERDNFGRTIFAFSGYMIAGSENSFNILAVLVAGGTAKHRGPFIFL